MMQAFERHFDTFQRLILECESDARVTARCSCGQELALYRCEECFCAGPSCKNCLLRSHHHLPFHHVQRWEGTYFSWTSLGTLGLNIFLGHDMNRCPNAFPDSKGRQFVVVHTNGIHTINIGFCSCSHAVDEPFQLVSAGLFPATVDAPETVFTFKMLKDFHAHTLASKKSTYDHYTALQKLTNNAFPDQTPVSNILILIF
jgi:hypothetical protein